MNKKIKFAAKLIIFRIESEPDRMCCMTDDINIISRRSFDTANLRKIYGINWYNYVTETPTIDSKNDNISKNFQSKLKPIMSYDNLEQLLAND